MTTIKESEAVNEVHVGFECTDRQRRILDAFVRQRGSNLAHEIRLWIESLEPELYEPLDPEG